MLSSSNNSVDYTELRSHRIKLNWPNIDNSYHQKTTIILKSNIMSKSNVKILQYKRNTWKGNYK